MNMNLYEQVYNLLWVGLSIWICIQSIQFKLWGPAGPHSGFLPFLVGLLMGACGLLLFFSEWSKGSHKDAIETFWEHPDTWKQVTYVLIGFFAMAFFMPIFGFFLTSIAVMAFLVFMVERKRLIKVILMSFIYCSCIYLFFHYALQIYLPKGLLRF
jgi:hypothetical protein